MIDIDTAVDLVLEFSKNRVVEPVRVCDKHSRFLITQYEKFVLKNKVDGVSEDEFIAAFQTMIDNKLDKIEK